MKSRNQGGSWDNRFFGRNNLKTNVTERADLVVNDDSPNVGKIVKKTEKVQLPSVFFKTVMEPEEKNIEID